MLSLVFTSLLPQATFGDQICFDFESGAVDDEKIVIEPGRERYDDEFGEETTSMVCAWQEPSSWQSKLTLRCREGVKRNNGRTEFGCIWFPDGVFMEDDNFKIAVLGSPSGDDAMWIDRVSVIGKGKVGHKPWRKQWGVSDTEGWCMSMSKEDYTLWDTIDTQNVPAQTCHAMMVFRANGDVGGWHDFPERELPVDGADGKLYGLATDGKVVERSGRLLRDADGNPVTLGLGDSFKVDAEGLPWVFKADGTIVGPWGILKTRGRRLSLDEPATPIQALAELIANTDETDTKHFVLENGDWVQLSQEEAKGMTTIVDEVDEVHPEVSEDARRRWSLPRFPGWPSGLKRCRDEMEMPCNMPCYGGGWMLVREIENGCCMNGPGGIDHPKPCGFTTKVCQKFYLCHRSG